MKKLKIKPLKLEKNNEFVGVYMTPEFIESLFRKGFSVITLEYIPQAYRVYGYGFDASKNKFYMLFRKKKCREGLLPVAVLPTFFQPSPGQIKTILENPY